MSDVVIAPEDIRPDLRGRPLHVTHHDTHALMPGEEASIRIAGVYEDRDPDYVVVHGDWSGSGGDEPGACVEIRAWALARLTRGHQPDGPLASFEAARAICTKRWAARQEAREQAELLARAGWNVEWREPGAEFGRGSGLMILASVYHPVTHSCPGDVTYHAG